MKNIKLNLSIGVFDSGIGGLTVLRQLTRFLPNEKFIYLGDTARVPYGNKSGELVNKYAAEAVNFLLKKGIKMLVVACNTVSAVSLERVKKEAGDIPVIGMVRPAAVAATRSTNSGNIGIIGTRATIESKAYFNEIRNIAGKDEISIFSKACPLFVPLAEEGMSRHPAAKIIAEDYLREMKNSGVDTLVLGCTHYPILSRLLQEIMPEAHLIDTGEHASVVALRILAEKGLLNETTKDYVKIPAAEFYVTDIPSKFHELAVDFLGHDIKTPTKISLGLA